MVKKTIFVKDGIKKKEYFFHETYEDITEALLIAKYYKKESNSRYFILKDEWSNKKKPLYHLYFDNIWNAI